MARVSEDRALVEALRKLGLTEYEARAYIAIVELGEAEAFEIARRSGVPRTRIYDILSRLEHSGLIQKIRGSRPALYASIPPERSLEHLKEKLFEEVSQAIDKLKMMYASSKAVSRCNVLLLRGDQAYESALKLLESAEEMIVARIIYLPSQVLEKILEKLRERLRKGIRVYLSMDLKLLRREVPLESLEEVLREFGGRAFSPPIPLSFLVADFRDLLLLYVPPDQPGNCYGFLVQDIGDVGELIKEHLFQDDRFRRSP